MLASARAAALPGTCAAAASSCWGSEVQVRDALSLEQLADEGVTVTVQHALSLIDRVEDLQRRCNVKCVPLEWSPVWLGLLKAELDPVEDAEFLSLIASAFDCKDSRAFEQLFYSCACTLDPTLKAAWFAAHTERVVRIYNEWRQSLVRHSMPHSA